jgi:hypothetical protein
MSEERFDLDESKDEDVEAHRRAAMANEEPGSEEESDDVEAHRRVRMGTDEPGADEGSDDVEAHLKRA